jgi:predicted transcriptional regulator
MLNKSAKGLKSFNSQVYSIACNRLKLKRREKVIFFRLLGFLIRNNKPFPYSSKSLSENTGYSESSIYESLNDLEKLRLIERIGFTSQVKFCKGQILKRICSLVQKRINIALHKNDTLVQKLEKITQTSPVSGYKKTSSSLKHKEKGFIFNPEYQEYVGRLKSNIWLGLIPSDTVILSLEQFLELRV